MAEKIMICNKCGKLFRVKISEESEITCPACNSNDVSSIYRKYGRI